MRDLVDSLTKTRIQGLESINLINPKPLKHLKGKGFSSKETSAKKVCKNLQPHLTLIYQYVLHLCIDTRSIPFQWVLI